MKKLISVLLAAAIIVSLLAPAGFAADGCSCGVNPTIYVGPLGNTDIYENPGTPEERVLFSDPKPIQ